MGVEYKKNPKKDYFDKIMDLLDDVSLIIWIILLLFTRMICLINNCIVSYLRDSILRVK